MALPAGDLIDEARDFNTAFSRANVADKSLLRRLAQARDRIIQRAMLEAEEFLTEPYVIDKETIDAALGEEVEDAVSIELPEHLLVSSGNVRIDGGVKGPLSLISYVHQYGGKFPAAWVEGRELRLVDLRTRGSGSTGWDAIEEIELLVIPMPPALTGLESVVPLPDYARNALIGELVAFMSGRAGVDLGVNAETVARDVDTVIATMIRQAQVGTWQVQRTRY